MKLKSYSIFFPFVIVCMLHALLFYIVSEKKVHSDLNFEYSSNSNIIHSSPIEINLKNRFKSQGKIKTKNAATISKTIDKSGTVNNNFSNDISQNIEIENEFKEGESSTFFDSFKLPKYPEMAREKNIEARVTVEIYFTNKGTVESINFLSEDHALFKSNIEKALKEWKLKSNIKTQKIVKTFYFKLK